MRALLLTSAAALCLSTLAGCGGGEGVDLSGVSSFQITISQVNGQDPPASDAPLPANLGDSDEEWQFAIQAVDLSGEPVDFDGYARVRVEPGSVSSVDSPSAYGRNIKFTKGKAAGTAFVTAVYGESRLWIEDMGYSPVDPADSPKCADGEDDDADGLVDYPADPGCAFADDDTEETGTEAVGVSPSVHYALPRVADIQGAGTETPFPFEGIQIGTASPQRVIVTRVSSDGFYVTDIDGPGGASNSLFAFNFSTPAGMRVCDRVDYLAGTVSEFFGFTELSFPTYDVEFWDPEKGDCPVPEPTALDAATIKNPVIMETLESSLVRVSGYHITKNFGPKPAVKNVFKEDQSSCDLNGDGQVDFENAAEASCANVCSADPECTEWTGFSARGNYKISSGSSVIQIQTSAVADFDPPSFRGQEIAAITGTMRNFSGGSLNWTIEARCPDDLVCSFSGACADEIKSSQEACVRPRNADDPDEGTN